MAMRSILCVFDGNDEELSALSTAAEFAKATGGRLVALHVTYLSSAYRGPYAEAAMAGGGWIEVIDNQRERMRDNARSLFEASCARHGLAAGDHSGRGPAARFVSLENATNADLIRALSLSDVVVAGSLPGSSEVIDRTPIDFALFSARRPVLVVRPSADDAPAAIVGAETAVAWDGSLPSIQALVAAAPLLAAQPQVTLLTAAERGTHPVEPALEYLAAHGVVPQHETVPVDGPAATAILDRARALGCGLLVSGAFGHSVLRERVLGGFTDSLLTEADLPVLLVH